MIIRIVPNEGGTPQSKLAEAELVFEDDVLDGLKLEGFGIWQGYDGRHVTFPSRPFVINGERRSRALLRPAGEDTSGQERLRAKVLQAFAEFEQATEKRARERQK
jgi:hypothetical protein